MRYLLALVCAAVLAGCQLLPTCPSDPSYPAVKVSARVPGGRLVFFKERLNPRSPVGLGQPNETIWIVEERDGTALVENDICQRGWVSAEFLRR